MNTLNNLFFIVIINIKNFEMKFLLKITKLATFGKLSSSYKIIFFKIFYNNNNILKFPKNFFEIY